MQGHSLAQALCSSHSRNQDLRGKEPFPVLRQWAQSSDDIGYYSAIENGRDRRIAIEIKHCKDDEEEIPPTCSSSHSNLLKID